MKISYALALTIAAVSAPALAQAPAAEGAVVAKGAIIFNSEGRRLGRVERVRDGLASLIYNGKIVNIPLATLTPTDRGYATSLTKTEIAKR